MQAPEHSESTFETEPDPGEPPSVAVVRAISAIEETRESGLPTLDDAVDPDALDALFDHDVADERVVVEVSMGGYMVEIRGDGTISARDEASYRHD